MVDLYVIRLSLPLRFAVISPRLGLSIGYFLAYWEWHYVYIQEQLVVSDYDSPSRAYSMSSMLWSDCGRLATFHMFSSQWILTFPVPLRLPKRVQRSSWFTISSYGRHGSFLWRFQSARWHAAYRVQPVVCQWSITAFFHIAYRAVVCHTASWAQHHILNLVYMFVKGLWAPLDLEAERIGAYLCHVIFFVNLN